MLFLNSRRTASALLRAAALIPTFFVVTSLEAQAAAGGEVLSNTSVVTMITGKVSKDLILTKIRTTKVGFDVTVAGLVRLHQSKVPQDVIKAMMTAASDPKMSVTGDAPPEILANSDVISMVAAQLPRAIILEKIRATKSKYDVTSEGLVSLNSNKVPADVVKAMMAAPTGTL
jgi:hypothetical protein